MFRLDRFGAPVQDVFVLPSLFQRYASPRCDKVEPSHAAPCEAQSVQAMAYMSGAFVCLRA